MAEAAAARQSALIGESRAQRLAPLLLGFLPVGLLGAVQGGYFPSAWGWATLGLLWATGTALVLRSSVRVTAAEGAWVLAWLALTGWIALSVLWSSNPTQTVLEVERTLIYAAGVCAVLALGEARFVDRLLGGVLVAVSAIALFSLATRLFPGQFRVYDPTAVYRLSHPIGYWNALAIFTAMGSILALGFAARGRSLWVRASSAAALVVLLPTFYFTFGRGGWVALGVGLVVAVLLDPRRLQLLTTLLVLAPIAGTAVWLASRPEGLTRAGALAERATADGRRLALELVLLGGVSIGAVSLLWIAERRVVVSARARSLFAAVLVLALAGGLVATFDRYGSPSSLVRKGYSAFKAPPPHVVNLNERLLSFSGNGRYDLWRLAWDDAGAHPWLGSGAGTYERYFLRHQPPNVGRVRDAHGLYIETLTELGPLGLSLLVAALGIPLLVVIRVRRHPLVPAAAGAYAAFLAHAAVDWDWEVPAVTLVGLICGGSLLLLGRGGRPPLQLAGRGRAVAVGGMVLVAAFAAVALVGNSALKASDSARREGDWNRAASEARLARRWLPWSSQPLLALGEAELGAGRIANARATFRKGISMDGKNWRLWYDLAQASRGRARALALRHVVALYPRSGLVAANTVKSRKRGRAP